MKELTYKFIIVGLMIFILALTGYAKDMPDWEDNYPDGCTSVTVGKLATSDGSVITSHTDDSHRTRSWIDIRSRTKHPAGSMASMLRRMPCDSLAMPAYMHKEVGRIPQVEETYGFINSAYPCMNEFQVGIGESTFGGGTSCSLTRDS